MPPMHELLPRRLPDPPPKPYTILDFVQERWNEMFPSDPKCSPNDLLGLPPTRLLVIPQDDLSSLQRLSEKVAKMNPYPPVGRLIEAQAKRLNPTPSA